MAAEESEVDAKRENRELFMKAMRMLATAQQQIIDATELLNALYEPDTRARAAIDENGEPSFEYLVKVRIPKDLKLTKRMVAYAAEKGFSAESTQILFDGKGTYEGFRKYYERMGTKWQSWYLVWAKWVRSERDRKDKAQATNGTGQTRFSRSRTRS